MGRKAASRESPERMLCAAKIIDRHLGEQKLLEMAAFLYAGRFDAYLQQEPGRISPAGNMVFPQELLAPGIQDLL